MAVKKPGPPIDIFAGMRKARERLDQISPVLETRWFVKETERRWEDEYGSDQGGKSRIVSNYFATREQAVKFTQDYDPDPGGTFTICSENLREYREKRWGV